MVLSPSDQRDISMDLLSSERNEANQEMQLYYKYSNNLVRSEGFTYSIHDQLKIFFLKAIKAPNRPKATIAPTPMFRFFSSSSKFLFFSFNLLK
jgi:hypothetical protein